jgi:hypothetical protein
MFYKAISAVLVLITFSITTVATAQQVEPELSDREQALQKLLSGAELRGSFTVLGTEQSDEKNDKAPKLSSEAYDLVEVKKLPSGLWLFKTRIRYGQHDVTLPISLPIEWAGDTPVVIVDNVGFPGLGTYSARVLFHGDRYAGYWQGADHGGHLFGTISRSEEEKQVDENTDETSENK